MHHVALDGTGPHDRHLDDEIIERRRLQPRQHRHLRAALDLECAERVGLLDHGVRGLVFGRNAREIEGQAAMRVQQVERTAHAAQHAEAENIDLHEAQIIDVVLVPFDDLAVRHGRRFDRHQLVEPVMRQHEAARMLTEMARESRSARATVPV